VAPSPAAAALCASTRSGCRAGEDGPGERDEAPDRVRRARGAPPLVRLDPPTGDDPGLPALAARQRPGETGSARPGRGRRGRLRRPDRAHPGPADRRTPDTAVTAGPDRPARRERPGDPLERPGRDRGHRPRPPPGSARRRHRRQVPSTTRDHAAGPPGHGSTCSRRSPTAPTWPVWLCQSYVAPLRESPRRVRRLTRLRPRPVPGLVVTVVGGLELGGGHVVAVAVEPAVVEPVDPLQGRDLDPVPGTSTARAV